MQSAGHERVTGCISGYLKGALVKIITEMLVAKKQSARDAIVNGVLFQFL
jgi:hypothetical protein